MHLLFGVLLAVISSCYPQSELSVNTILENIEAAKVSFIEVHETRASADEEEHVHDENCDHDHEEE